MTISTPLQDDKPQPTIQLLNNSTSIYSQKTRQPSTESRQSQVVTPIASTIKDQTIQDLGISSDDTTIDEPNKPIQTPVKLKIADMNDKKVSDLSSQATTTLTDVDTIPGPIVERLEPNVDHLDVDLLDVDKKAASDNEKVEVTDDIEKIAKGLGYAANLDELADIKVLEKPEDLAPLATTATDNTIKEVDSLGASGILLDILADQSENKQKIEDKETLEAAENLLNKAKINVKIDSSTKNESVITQSENVAKEEKTDDRVDDTRNDEGKIKNAGSAKNDKSKAESAETTNGLPAIESVGSPESLFAPAVDEAIFADMPSQKKKKSKKLKLNKKLKEEIKEELEHLGSEPIDQIAQDSKADVAPEAELAPDSVSSISVQDGQTRKDVAPSPDSSDESNAADSDIEKAKVETETTIPDPPKEDKTVESSALAEVEDASQQKPKSEHVKNYFSHILSQDRNDLKSKKIKQKKKRGLKLFYLAFIGILAIFFGLAGYYYYYFSNTPLVKYEQQTTQADFSINLPSEVPAGYEITNDTIFSKETETYYVVYLFQTDKNRKITFYQTKTDNADQSLKDFSADINQGFTTKTENNVEYTIYDNGSIAWKNDGFLYKIRVEGDTYKDLVYKMALSVEQK